MKRFTKTVGISSLAALLLSICVIQADRTAGAATGTAGPAGVDPTLLNGVQWRFVGPVRGGRTEAVVGNSKDPLVFYFGSAHGGVWKTTDAGIYWWNVSDGFFKTAPVGAIDESLSNPAKTLNMSGLRLGWLATPDRQFLENCMNVNYYHIVANSSGCFDILLTLITL